MAYGDVPARLGGFSGRDDELDRLAGAPGRTTVVTGLGGIGKSALVAEFCHRTRRDAGAVGWIRATNRAAAVAGLRGTTDADLVVFDDVPRAGWIEDLVPAGPTIITTRWRDWPTEWASIPVGPLSLDETAELLARERPTDGGVRRLAIRLGGLALAAVEATAYCQAHDSDYDAYAHLLDTGAPDVFGPGTALGRLLDTILDDVCPESPLAETVLAVCAHLPATGIAAVAFVGDLASAEPLLRHGDEVATTAALRALERFSLLEKESAGPASYRTHRLIQALCRANAGDARDEYARTARRLRRRPGRGWDYLLSDSGSVVVAMERATGRLLLTSTAGADEPVELPMPPAAVDPPTAVEVTEAQVTARYPMGTATWTLDARAPAVTTATRLLNDSYERDVRLPDGRVMTIWGGSPLQIELGEWSRELDPGSYSGSRRVVATPVIDPTGEWLLVSMYMSKVVDHGWIAAWRLADVLDDDTEPESGDEDGFLPNVHKWAGAEEDPNATRDEAVSGLCFDSTGTRLYLLDRRTIHGWSWPGQQALWRVRRPEVVPAVQDVRLGAAVVTCVRVTRTDHVRAALADGRIVDIDPVDLRVRTIGHSVPPAAMSPADGAILPAGAGIRTAFGTDDGTFICRTDQNRLVRRELDGRTTDLGCEALELVSVHHSGTAAVVREGANLRHLAIGRSATRDIATASLSQQAMEQFGHRPTTVAWMTANRLLVLSTYGCWWSATSGTIGQVDYWHAEMIALAADGHVVVAGSDTGDVSLRTYEGMPWHCYLEGEEKFVVRVADEPVRWVFPLLADNRIVAVTAGGQLSALRWD